LIATRTTQGQNLVHDFHAEPVWRQRSQLVVLAAQAPVNSLTLVANSFVTGRTRRQTFAFRDGVNARASWCQTKLQRRRLTNVIVQGCSQKSRKGFKTKTILEVGEGYESLALFRKANQWEVTKIAAGKPRFEAIMTVHVAAMQSRSCAFARIVFGWQKQTGQSSSTASLAPFDARRSFARKALACTAVSGVPSTSIERLRMSSETLRH
jgi:hypothetical protein